jgi:DNA-binding response OmpR family regulator
MPALPLLLVLGKGVADDAVSELAVSPRVQLFRAPDLHSSPTAFARRSARATIVATLDDPLRDLVFVRTGGFTGPLILAIDPHHEDARADLLDADVIAVLTLPITTGELNRVLDIVELQPLPPIARAELDLFVDAIDRTARHGEAVVRLSPREFALLHCLIGTGTTPVTVREIYDYVWGGQRTGDAMREIVHVNVSQLRKKLSQIGLQEAIQTHRDFGYSLREFLP